MPEISQQPVENGTVYNLEIETPYCTLYYPARWAGTVSYEVDDSWDVVYKVHFYSRISGLENQLLFSIYFGGDDSRPAAYVEVNVFGRSVPGSAWEKLTEQIMAALSEQLSIPQDRTYIRYTATTDWGWNGGNF